MLVANPDYWEGRPRLSALEFRIIPDPATAQARVSRRKVLECMTWAGTGVLWTVVNERDGLGDETPPDYLTSVRDGGFYGWPYAYTGPNEDPRRKGEAPDKVKSTITPAIRPDSHTGKENVGSGMKGK